MSKKQIFVLVDETGSMLKRFYSVVKSVNAYIKELPKGVRVTMSKFNSTFGTRHLCISKKPKNVPKLSRATYGPRGATPLYDAIYDVINTAEDCADIAPLIVIQTDGEENASTLHTRQEIERIIKEKTDSGWTFVFLGADIDAVEIGVSLGILRGNILGYNSAKTAETFSTLSMSTRRFVNSDGSTDSFFDGGALDARISNS